MAMADQKTATGAEGVRWDLSDLFGGPDDPRLDATMSEMERRAIALESANKGRLGECAPTDLAAALQEYEAIHARIARALYYANMLFEADSATPGNGVLLQRLTERQSEIVKHLLFVDLEIIAFPDVRLDRLLDDPLLAPYAHYIEKTVTFRPHRLSEREEGLLEDFANVGERAWERLHTQVTSAMTFTLVENGETKTLNLSEVQARLHSPDRDLRRAAVESLASGMAPHESTLALVYNMIIAHKSVTDRLRSFAVPEESRHKSNELTPQAVDTVVETVASRFALVADYYRLKREILGYDRLYYHDVLAPLFGESVDFPWERARDLVVEAYRALSPEVGSAIERFFSDRWIDAEIRKGKAGGAFCAGITPDLHPYVLMNYAGKLRDVTTLAHELGHGLHDVQASRQNFLNFHPVLPTAEMASTFGELLVFDRLLAELDDSRAKLSLLAGKIEDSIGTVFRQISYYRFEQRAHRLRREQGDLPPAVLHDLFMEETRQLFGGSLEVDDTIRAIWLRIPHFVGTPFYVYAYPFGELLSMGLFARYRAEGAPFVPRFLGLLSLGGSLSPAKLLARVGIDIDDPAFWNRGLDQVAAYVEQMHRLWEETR